MSHNYNKSLLYIHTVSIKF